MDLIIFFVALSVLVFFHELGHFVMARKTGVRVDEFGIGLPPRLFGKKVGETIYSVNALPIGGFCKLYGEDPPTASQSGGQVQSKYKDRSFYFKKPWQKSLILVGGVTMNLILAIIIFTGVFYKTGIPVELDKVIIEEVAEGSPASEVGLIKNDVILEVNGETVKTSQELIEKASQHKGGEVDLLVEKQDKSKEKVMVAVRENPPEGEGSMGVVISSTKIEKFPIWQAYKGVWQGFKEAYFWGRVILDGLGKMIAGVFSGQVPKDVAGPVGMYQVTASVRKDTGMLGVMHFFGIISVNLAVVNLLPFPALDGGRLVFVLVEKISGKKIDEKFEATANAVGMSILLGLLLLVTVGDVVRLLK